MTTKSVKGNAFPRHICLADLFYSLADVFGFELEVDESNGKDGRASEPFYILSGIPNENLLAFCVSVKNEINQGVADYELRSGVMTYTVGFSVVPHDGGDVTFFFQYAKEKAEGREQAFDFIKERQAFAARVAEDRLVEENAKAKAEAEAKEVVRVEEVEAKTFTPSMSYGSRIHQRQAGAPVVVPTPDGKKGKKKDATAASLTLFKPSDASLYEWTTDADGYSPRQCDYNCDFEHGAGESCYLCKEVETGPATKKAKKESKLTQLNFIQQKRYLQERHIKRILRVHPAACGVCGEEKKPEDWREFVICNSCSQIVMLSCIQDHKKQLEKCIYCRNPPNYGK